MPAADMHNWDSVSTDVASWCGAAGHPAFGPRSRPSSEVEARNGRSNADLAHGACNYQMGVAKNEGHGICTRNNRIPHIRP